MSARAAQLTLTSANTNYSIYELASAIDSAFPPNVRELSFQVDAGAGTLLIGDVNMTATRYGKLYDPATTDVVRDDKNSISLRSIYFRSAQAGKIVNVMVEVL
jgi:hypothetical protein